MIMHVKIMPKCSKSAQNQRKIRRNGMCKLHTFFESRGANFFEAKQSILKLSDKRS